jgi:hypothetical protein
MMHCQSDTLNWSLTHDDDDDDDDHHFPKDFFKYTIKLAGIPPFETRSIPNDVWDSFWPKTECDERKKSMIITAMAYCIRRDIPEIELPQHTSLKHLSYNETIKYMYEAALRNGFGSTEQRGNALMDDLGL